MTGVLLSFHYNRDTDLEVFPPHVPIFADSGAYSAATTGVGIELNDYAKWLHTWRHRITVAASLDVIGDPEATAANTAALAADGHPVLPVFHYGTPMPVLAELCRRHPYIALGGMVAHRRDPAPLMRWMANCFKTARGTGTVFHGFGQTKDNVTSRLPFYSADSSTWSAGARYGRLPLWDERRARFKRILIGHPIRDLKVRALLRDHGADIAWLEQPGFGRQSKGRAGFRDEYTELERLSMIAFERFELWLGRRHHVAPPPGQTRTGTVVYLAAVNDQVPRVVRAFERNAKARTP